MARNPVKYGLWEDGPDDFGVPNEHVPDAQDILLSDPNFVSDNVKEGMLESLGTFNITWGSTGLSKDEWMELNPGNTADETFLVVLFPMKLIGVSASSSNTNRSYDIEIHYSTEGQAVLDQSILHTSEVRGARTYWQTSGMPATILNPGDKIGVYVRDQGNDPRNISINTLFSITSLATEVGDESFNTDFVIT